MNECRAEEHPTACSIQVRIEFGVRIPASEVQERIDGFLGALRSFLRENGCRLIGHIKGMLAAGESGRLYFSVTSFDDDPRYKGKLDGEISEAELSMNVIVYGVGEAPVEKAARELLKRQVECSE